MKERLGGQSGHILTTDRVAELGDGGCRVVSHPVLALLAEINLENVRTRSAFSSDMFNSCREIGRLEIADRLVQIQHNLDTQDAMTVTVTVTFR